MERTKERIGLPHEMLGRELDMMRHYDHIRRYQLVKRYCFGRVVDAACGVGYGSHLLSDNPDITGIVGVDNNEEALAMADAEYADAKITFVRQDVTELDMPCSLFFQRQLR